MSLEAFSPDPIVVLRCIGDNVDNHHIYQFRNVLAGVLGYEVEISGSKKPIFGPIIPIKVESSPNPRCTLEFQADLSELTNLQKAQVLSMLELAFPDPVC